MAERRLDRNRHPRQKIELLRTLVAAARL